MKKNLLSTLFITLFVAMAQLSSAQISFGPRIGVNAATVAGVNNNAGFKLGLHVGGFVKLKLGESLAFQPELLYSVKGEANVNNNSTSSEKLALNYLDIPLLLNVGGSKGVHFLIGAQPSFLLSAKEKIKSGGNTTKTDVKSSINGFDIAPVIGIGYQAEGGFSFDFRTSYGIPDIIANNSSGNSQHNLNLQLTFGYTIGGN
jgi:hypothetical protein